MATGAARFWPGLKRLLLAFEAETGPGCYFYCFLEVSLLVGDDVDTQDNWWYTVGSGIKAARFRVT
jgi:hypothetical protein